MKKISSLLIAFIWASLIGISQTPHTDYIGAGHTSGVTLTTSGTGFFGEGEIPLTVLDSTNICAMLQGF